MVFTKGKSRQKKSKKTNGKEKYRGGEEGKKCKVRT